MAHDINYILAVFTVCVSINLCTKVMMMTAEFAAVQNYLINQTSAAMSSHHSTNTLAAAAAAAVMLSLKC